MRETHDEFQGGLQIGGRMITNLRYADDIMNSVGNFGGRSAGVGGSSRPSQPQVQPINIDKTKVMASDGIACRILIQNEQLEQVNTFLYLGSLITEDGGVYDRIPY